MKPRRSILSVPGHVAKMHAGAADEAAQHGLGAVAVEGRMVDGATVRLARQTWAHARHLGLV